MPLQSATTNCCHDSFIVGNSIGSVVEQFQDIIEHKAGSGERCLIQAAEDHDLIKFWYMRTWDQECEVIDEEIHMAKLNVISSVLVV
jgi:hypothetical protein